jgi:hypothetical protein
MELVYSSETFTTRLCLRSKKALLYNNFFGIIKSRRMRWAEHVARMGEKRNVYRLLVGKPEGK